MYKKVTADSLFFHCCIGQAKVLVRLQETNRVSGETRASFKGKAWLHSGPF